MPETALHYQTISALAPRIKSGELSPLTLTEALLARIKTLNPPLNAFRLITDQRALACAQAAETQIRNGHYLGPLHGIPYAIKDIFNVQGLPTTAGSNTLLDNIADADATATRKLAQAGMVLLGKTNTVEFAFGSVGINHSHGTPHNPWHQQHHVPGGSSSGSAVAVAAGMAPMGMGSDTACSVRGPAALCGTVGLKTTVGRISRYGVYPLSSTLDSIGPLTRCVQDAALIYNVLQGHDHNDSGTVNHHHDDALATLNDGVQGLRIVYPESTMSVDVDPEVAQAVAASRAIFQDLGAQTDTIAYPEADAALALAVSPSMVEGCAVNTHHLDNSFDQLDPVVAKRMISGRDIAAVDYVATLTEMQRLREQSQQRLRNIDALVVPTTMVPALPLSEVDADLETYMHYAKVYMRNCYVGNLLNLCAVTVPCGFTEKGLPIGLQIYAKPFHEPLALRIAQAFEQAVAISKQPDLSWC